MSAEARVKSAHLPVLFTDVNGEMWMNVATRLRPAKIVSRRPREFRLLRLTQDEAALVRSYVGDALIEAWARLTA